MSEFRFNKEDSSLLKAFISSLGYTYPSKIRVTHEESFLDIDDLAKKLGPYTFSTITHLDPHTHPERKLRTALGGVKKYLGYDETAFDFMKSLSIIEGIFRVIVIEYGKAVYEVLKTDEIRKKVTGDTTYTIPYLVRHERGHLVSVVQHSSFHQIEKGNNFTVQLNIFHVNRHYSFETMIARPHIHHPIDGFFSKELKQIRDIAIPRILNEIKKTNNNRPFLTPGQYRTAIELSQNESAHEIAEKMRLKTDTIHDYSKKILNRVGTLFPGRLNFRTGSEASWYLKQLGFLDYPDHYNQK